MKTKAQKWGNSLAVRVPHGVAQAAGLKANDALDGEVVKGKIVLTPSRPKACRKYRLEELVRGISARNRYKETEFGAPVGREAW